MSGYSAHEKQEIIGGFEPTGTLLDKLGEAMGFHSARKSLQGVGRQYTNKE